MLVRRVVNGITVAVEEKKYTKKRVDDIIVYIIGGTHNETSRVCEYYHILEHAYKYLPSHKYSTDDNKLLFGIRGIECESQVSEYFTKFTLHNSHTSKIGASRIMIERVVESLCSPYIDERTYDNAISSVRNELQSLLDDPFSVYSDNNKKVYGGDHISSKSLLNRLKSVKMCTYETFSDFLKHAIVPQRVILYYKGKLNLDKLCSTLGQIQNNIQPVFSLSKMRESIVSTSGSTSGSTNTITDTKKRGVPSMYYTFIPSITTKYQLRYNIVSKLVDKCSVYISECVLRLVQELLSHLNNQNKVTLNIDAVDESLSYLCIEGEGINQSNIEAQIKDIVESLSVQNFKQILSKVTDLSLLKPEDTLDSKIINIIIGKPEVETFITSKKDVYNMYKRCINNDKLYLMYCGPFELFNN